ncbi:type II toxin-antitoxin system VapC family toxin [Candidatus Gottesmanbacteria bacterium]|nr:type II toxin-antitoxin system VapC family toxin [Candidatus Gottesmanbacteria bacterium]
MKKCYLDSNVLVYFKFEPLKHHGKAERVILSFDYLFISPLTIDEFIHSLRFFLRRDKYKEEEIIKLLEQALDSILALDNLTIINPPTDKTSNRSIIKLMQEFHLGPRDAYHLLIMKENNIGNFATFDTDFKYVFRKKVLKLFK